MAKGHSVTRSVPAGGTTTRSRRTGRFVTRGGRTGRFVSDSGSFPQELDELYGRNRQTAAQVYVEAARRAGRPVPAKIQRLADPQG